MTSPATCNFLRRYNCYADRIAEQFLSYKSINIPSHRKGMFVLLRWRDIRGENAG